MTLIPSLSNAEVSWSDCETSVEKTCIGKKVVACPIPTYTYYMIMIQNSHFCSAKEKAYIQVGMENHVFTH